MLPFLGEANDGTFAAAIAACGLICTTIIQQNRNHARAKTDRTDASKQLKEMKNLVKGLSTDVKENTRATQELSGKVDTVSGKLEGHLLDHEA